MLLSKLKSSFRAPSSKVQQIHPKIYALSSAQESYFQACFLFIGCHGNLLVGLSTLTPDIKDILTKLGGVKYVFPREISKHFEASASVWFKTFGCKFIFSEIQPSWPVPWIAINQLAQLDALKVSPLPTSNDTLMEWKVSFIGRSYFSKFSDEENHSDHGFLLCFQPSKHRHLRSFVHHLAPPQDKQTAVSTLTEHLVHDKILAFSFPELPIIALFDDIEFERFDLEIISPKTRSSVIQSFSSLQKLDRVDRNFKYNELIIAFAKPPRSMSTPLYDMLETKDSDILITTPTQLAAYLCENITSSDHLSGYLQALVAKLPINIHKLKSQYPMVTPMERSLLQIQEKTTRHYKSRRPKNCIGRLPPEN